MQSYWLSLVRRPGPVPCSAFGSGLGSKTTSGGWDDGSNRRGHGRARFDSGLISICGDGLCQLHADILAADDARRLRRKSDSCDPWVSLLQLGAVLRRSLSSQSNRLRLVDARTSAHCFISLAVARLCCWKCSKHRLAGRLSGTASRTGSRRLRAYCAATNRGWIDRLAGETLVGMLPMSEICEEGPLARFLFAGALAMSVVVVQADGAEIRRRHDFSGLWIHPTLPGFEQPLSGPGPVRNWARSPRWREQFQLPCLATIAITDPQTRRGRDCQKKHGRIVYCGQRLSNPKRPMLAGRRTLYVLES